MGHQIIYANTDIEWGGCIKNIGWIVLFWEQNLPKQDS